MIRNFRHKGLERLFAEGSSRGVKQAHVPRLRRILALLNRASSPQAATEARERQRRGIGTIATSFRGLLPSEGPVFRRKSLLGTGTTRTCRSCCR